ncbi:hypothetical protein OH76DRAFT_886818 [Lentinus brumalis]|uniref:Uncharacterized protein n=1 Tax=Lentinus brumalis TaxID=2498619 RepID=A0A371D1F5_9APHY|nr:hypothetical protein OH76DRAFT_886818 [Polyporus brumalis]
MGRGCCTQARSRSCTRHIGRRPLGSRFESLSQWFNVPTLSAGGNFHIRQHRRIVISSHAPRSAGLGPQSKRARERPSPTGILVTSLIFRTVTMASGSPGDSIVVEDTAVR